MEQTPNPERLRPYLPAYFRSMPERDSQTFDTKESRI